MQPLNVIECASPCSRRTKASQALITWYWTYRPRQFRRLGQQRHLVPGLEPVCNWHDDMSDNYRYRMIFVKAPKGVTGGDRGILLSTDGPYPSDATHIKRTRGP